MQLEQQVEPRRGASLIHELAHLHPSELQAMRDKSISMVDGL